MITNYPVLARLSVSLLDTLVTILSFIVAVYVRNLALELHAFGGEIVWTDYGVILLVIILVWRGLLGFQEAYVGQRFTSLRGDLLIVIKTVVFGCLMVLTIAFMIKSNVPRTLIAFFGPVNFIFLSFEKILLNHLIIYFRKKGKNIKKALVLGAGDVAKKFIDSVETRDGSSDA